MRFFIFAALCLVAACADRIEAPIVPEALQVGEVRKIYVATSRSYENGVYGIGRAEELTLLNALISMPKDRVPGQISNGRARPNPERDFVLAKLEPYASAGKFRADIARDISAVPQNGSRDQFDVTIYVHGFNNSFSDSAFRMAQLASDTWLQGPVVSYAWPSRANPFGYEYDVDSTLFARDGLVELLHEVRASGAKRVVLLGHSMGARLVMEALRQLEIGDPGWTDRNIAGILLFSPDVNVDVFRSQVSHFKVFPQPFVIFKSNRDRLLRLSATLRGDDARLGNLTDISPVAEFPITFIDVSNFDDGDAGNHFVAGTSSEFLRLIQTSRKLDDGFLEGRTEASVSVLGGPRVVRNSVTVAPVPGEQ